MIWSLCTAIVIVLNVVTQEVWCIADAQADKICTAVRDALDVNEGEEGIMLLRGGLIRLNCFS